MKIYTRVVCAWQPDGSLKRIEEESFEYGGAIALCKDSPSPPPAPDYTGAAKATNTSQRTNQYTPYGDLIWTPGADAIPGRPASGPTPIYGGGTPGYTDPSTGGYFAGNPANITGYTPGDPGSAGTPEIPWSSKITLSPQAQEALDTQMQASTGMGKLGLSQMPRLEEQYSKGMDLSSVQDVADKAYGAMTSRLDPQWQKGESMQKTQLANQGLVPGGEAYNDAMRVFNQGKNDAYQQANLGAIQTMPQTYALAESQYNQPLNTMNAIRSGTQIQNPQFGAGAGGAGTDYLGAVKGLAGYQQGLYGAQVGETNAANANTTSAVSTAAMIAVMI